MFTHKGTWSDPPVQKSLFVLPLFAQSTFFPPLVFWAYFWDYIFMENDTAPKHQTRYVNAIDDAAWDGKLKGLLNTAWRFSELVSSKSPEVDTTTLKTGTLSK